MSEEMQTNEENGETGANERSDLEMSASGSDSESTESTEVELLQSQLERERLEKEKARLFHRYNLHESVDPQWFQHETIDGIEEAFRKFIGNRPYLVRQRLESTNPSPTNPARSLSEVASLSIAELEQAQRMNLSPEGYIELVRRREVKRPQQQFTNGGAGGHA